MRYNSRAWNTSNNEEMQHRRRGASRFPHGSSAVPTVVTLLSRLYSTRSFKAVSGEYLFMGLAGGGGALLPKHRQHSST